MILITPKAPAASISRRSRVISTTLMFALFQAKQVMPEYKRKIETMGKQLRLKVTYVRYVNRSSYQRRKRTFCAPNSWVHGKTRVYHMTDLTD
jgi:hypothetical protein